MDEESPSESVWALLLRGPQTKRERRRVAIGVLVVVFIVIPVLVLAGSAANSHAPACSLVAQDEYIEVHLSPGKMTCTDVDTDLAEYLHRGSLAQIDPNDPAVTDCVLTQNGQTATVSYGSNLGDSSVADNYCESLIESGWSQQ